MLSLKHILFTLSSFILFTIFSMSPAFADSNVTCNQYTVPVTLSSTDPTVYHVVGFLCSEGSLQGKTVQFLLHGLTYDHNYWNFPLSPEKYSYVRKATDEGYATFNIDRLGDGLSDRPLATSVTIESGAFVAHQIVQDLRAGNIGGTSFAKVIEVGHSGGSSTIVFEASQYHDVDGVILSGFMHAFNFPGIAEISTTIYPAQLDPKFANSNIPDGYFTTIPNTRASDFYNTADADPNVIALDETLKQTVTSGELGTISDAAVNTSLTQQIHVPVLIVNGQFDKLFCNDSLGLSCDSNQAILSRESGNFTPQACLEASVLTNSGHDVNLHLNAHSWFETANDWANRRVGNSVNTPPTQPCQ